MGSWIVSSVGTLLSAPAMLRRECVEPRGSGQIAAWWNSSAIVTQAAGFVDQQIAEVLIEAFTRANQEGAPQVSFHDWRLVTAHGLSAAGLLMGHAIMTKARWSEAFIAVDNPVMRASCRSAALSLDGRVKLVSTEELREQVRAHGFNPVVLPPNARRQSANPF